jgi:hypothetical protein
VAPLRAEGPRGGGRDRLGLGPASPSESTCSAESRAGETGWAPRLPPSQAPSRRDSARNPHPRRSNRPCGVTGARGLRRLRSSGCRAERENTLRLGHPGTRIRMDLVTPSQQIELEYGPGGARTADPTRRRPGDPFHSGPTCSGPTRTTQGRGRAAGPGFRRSAPSGCSLRGREKSSRANCLRRTACLRVDPRSLQGIMSESILARYHVYACTVDRFSGCAPQRAGSRMIPYTHDPSKVSCVCVYHTLIMA